ncbi:hypothetical protein TNCT_523921 [Trichonephila clavata]|uniref:Uncharacterized protein n=1 Tax=Trichonephila clavata TaxID=2740835 RepID=A0A8X6LH75_TRICU|nr:hypothetical protein TNCT_523921 [Trichonephila clavata]
MRLCAGHQSIFYHPALSKRTAAEQRSAPMSVAPDSLVMGLRAHEMKTSAGASPQQFGTLFYSRSPLPVPNDHWPSEIRAI